MKLFLFEYKFEGKSHTDYIIANYKETAIALFRREYVHVNIDTVNIMESVKNINYYDAMMIDPHTNVVRFL